MMLSCELQILGRTSLTGKPLENSANVVLEATAIMSDGGELKMKSHL